MAGPGSTPIPKIVITDVDGASKWNLIKHLCYNDLLRPSQPYQCIYHFDGGGQCSKFLDQGQRRKAAFIMNDLAHKDLRDVTEEDRRNLLSTLLCDAHLEKSHLARELRRTKAALETLLTEEYGSYDKDWEDLEDHVFARYGVPSDADNWIRWITLEALPTSSDLETEIPWPVESGDWREVNPDTVKEFYKQILFQTLEYTPLRITRTRIPWNPRGAEFMRNERKRWKPLQEIFAAMKSSISEDGYFYRVADLVEVVWKALEEILGLLEGSRRYPFNTEETYRPQEKVIRAKWKR